jgi:hypothetical protein
MDGRTAPQCASSPHELQGGSRPWIHPAPLDPAARGSLAGKQQKREQAGFDRWPPCWLPPAADATGGRGRRAAALPKTNVKEQRRCRGRRERDEEGGEVGGEVKRR